MDTTTPTTGANGQEGLLHNLRHMVNEADQFLKTAAQSGDAKFDAVRGRFASISGELARVIGSRPEHQWD